jgi:hypothetical protein
MFGRRRNPRRVPLYRRLRAKPITRDDSGYFSAFLVAKPMLGELCAADTGGGDWRPCPMSKCKRPDHDHVRLAAPVEPAAQQQKQRVSGSSV